MKHYIYGTKFKYRAQKCFHPSIEGAQHGAKSPAEFLDYAKKAGASRAKHDAEVLATFPGNEDVTKNSGSQRANYEFNACVNVFGLFVVKIGLVKKWPDGVRFQPKSQLTVTNKHT